VRTDGRHAASARPGVTYRRPEPCLWTAGTVNERVELTDKRNQGMKWDLNADKKECMGLVGALVC
jgi:hypothetical protein